MISAPTATGKTTLVAKLIEEFPERIVKSCSCTTREKRPGEIEGKDYFFLSKNEMNEKIQKDLFLESTLVYDHWYGTLKSEVFPKLDEGKNVILVLDTQGALKIKDHYPAVLIFIHPPSLIALEQRLESRLPEKDFEKKKRWEAIPKEEEKAKWYDYQIVNDDLELCYQILRSIIIAESHKS